MQLCHAYGFLTMTSHQNFEKTMILLKECTLTDGEKNTKMERLENKQILFNRIFQATTRVLTEFVIFPLKFGSA